MSNTIEETAKIQFDKFIERMGNWHQAFVANNDEGRMEFCRKVKERKTLTYPKGGTGLGDLRYSDFENFKPL